jgi:hypothetical protein
MISPCRSHRAAPRRHRQEQTDGDSLRRHAARRSTASATTNCRNSLQPRGGDARPGTAPDPDGAGDDGAGRRPARARHQPTAAPSSACFTDRPGVLTNDFFVNPARHARWKATAENKDVFEGTLRDRKTGAPSGPPRASTSSSVRTRCCAPLPRSMHSTTRRRSSSGLRRRLDQGDERRPLRSHRLISSRSQTNKVSGPDHRARFFVITIQR